ncbi:MAG: hypothetical protein A2046_13845 [Bacteroidetes bacterium GWA2_30_7]|nr:MAG: hypothetical protein A2046_13845 [Bacteroidetes bacterium GWA2_30_7]
MILPHPESDLSLNLMVVGSDIINLMQSKGRKDNFVLVENILEEFLKKDIKRTPDMFIYSLVFLYSVGLIEQKDYKIKLLVKKFNPIQGVLF